MFYIWENQIHVAPEGDVRGHKEWINDQEIYDNCIRGYYKAPNLYVYTHGDGFKIADLREFTAVVSEIIKVLELPVKYGNPCIALI